MLESLRSRCGFAALLLVLVAALLSCGSSPPPESDEFRGMKWGSHASDHTGLSLVAEDGDYKFFQREKESLKLGDAPLDRVVYGFYKDRFYSAMLYFRSPEHFTRIREVLAKQHGELVRTDPNSEKYYRDGDRINLMATFDPPSQSGRVSYFFKPIQLETEMAK